MCKIISTDVPYNAKVSFLEKSHGDGFLMKQLEPWLKAAINAAG
jgi:hypothetical protein